jgi:peptidoglycan/LPS O-acetylase OafA/YrhL/O-antigen/teichoic acid export membrane protein
MSDVDLRGLQRNRALIRSGLTAAVTRGGTTIATLLSVPLLAHLLGVKSYGVLVTLTATSMLLSVGDFGIANGLVSKLSGNKGGDKRARELLSSAYALTISASIAGTVVATIAAFALPWPTWTKGSGLPDSEIRVAALIALLGVAFQLTTNIGQKIELAHQRTHAASLWLGSAFITAPLVAALAAAVTDDLRLTIAGLSFTPPLILLVESALVIRALPATQRPTADDVNRATVRELLRTGAEFTGIAVIAMIAFQLATLVVSNYLGPAEAARYNIAIRVFGLVSATIHVAMTQLWSAFADATKHDDIRWARNALIKSTYLCASLSLVFSVALVFVTSPIVERLLGHAFVPSQSLLVSAAIWTIVSGAASPLSFFLNGNEMQRTLLWAGIPMVVATLPTSIWLVQVMGSGGPLVASSICWTAFVAIPCGWISLNLLRRQEAEMKHRLPNDSDPMVAAAAFDAGLVPPETGATEATADHRYRPDIDGLRAGAVLAVIGFHYFPGLFPGGFVGVDVFFVLSGFLITGLMVNRIGAGSFTIRDFYARRIRRIFPALSVVLLTTLITGWVVLFTDEFRQLAKQTAAGAFFVANFFFWNQESYFDPGAYSKPLLHLWSLAIEEQFYLVWPLAILLMLRLGRRRALTGVLVITIASFAVNLVLAGSDPTADYYFSVARFWELSAGAALALLAGGGTVRRVLVANVMSVLGLLLIAYSVLAINADQAYPSAVGALPVIGTALLIMSEPSFLNRRVLTFKPIVGIGLISYPLYLWHWPLIAFTTVITHGFPSGPMRLALIMFAFALSIATKYLVEQPLRFGRLAMKAPPRLALGIATLGVLGVVAGTSIGPSAAHSSDSAPPATIGAWDYSTNRNCESRYDYQADPESGWWFCVANTKSDPQVLLLGDSYANALYPGMAAAFADRAVLSIGTCAPTRGLIVYSAAADPNNPCFGRKGRVQERFMVTNVLHASRIPLVVIDSAWPTFDAQGRWVAPGGAPGGTIKPFSGRRPAGATDESLFVSGLVQQISDLQQRGDQVVLVAPKPEIGYDIAHCYPRPFNTNVEPCTVPVAQLEVAQESFRGVVSAVRKSVPQVKVFDPAPLFCNATTCSVIKDGQPLLRDGVHYSTYGSKLFATALKSWLAADTR